MYSIFFTLLVYYCCSKSTFAQLYDGDDCLVNISGAKGVCKKINQCPPVLDQMKNGGIKPTVCGFEGFNSIVCCPKLQLSTRPTRRPPTLPPLPQKERLSVTLCNNHTICILGILGGVNTNLGDYPHMVALGWPLPGNNEFAWNCGGTLISRNYVLTAAHCTYSNDPSLASESPTVVRLGEVNIKNDNGGEDIEISKILVHNQYRAPSKYHDIALLKLARLVIPSAIVRPACLWLNKDIGKKSAIATGWGKTSNFGSTSNILQNVEVQLVDNESCASSYTNSRKLINGIVKEQICAGDPEGGKDSCQGDSGGPLQIKQNCAHYVIGVTSFGIGCGVKGIPGVYSRVSSYVDWIENMIANDVM